MIDELNIKASKLITLLEKKAEASKKGDKSKNLNNLKGTSMILDLGEVKNLKSFNSDGFGNKVSAFAHLKDINIGLSIKNYKFLQEIAQDLLEIEAISSKADFEFLESEIFEWIIKCYSDMRIKQSMFDYVTDRIDIECKEYAFYFKILALAIDNKFKFGGIEITYLSNQKSSANKINDETFNEFKDCVLAYCKTFGVKSKAIKAAKDKVGIAISALKILFIEETVVLSNQLFDVDFRQSNTDFSLFLSETGNEGRFTRSMSRTQGSHPIIINKNKFEILQKSGFEKLSYFLQQPVNKPLYLELLEGINHFGKTLSNRNIHERIVELISFIERFVVPKNDSRAYGQKRIKEDVIPKLPFLNGKEEKYKSLITKFYKVRDRYLHNRIELSINLYDLYEFQIFCRSFLFYLIEIIESNNTLDDIHSRFEIKKPK